MKKYLSVKAALTDPFLLKAVLKFHVASASFLTHLATGGDETKPFTQLSFPLGDSNTRMIGCMPEFVITNITSVMIIARRFKQSYMQVLVSFFSLVSGCLAL